LSYVVLNVISPVTSKMARELLHVGNSFRFRFQLLILCGTTLTISTISILKLNIYKNIFKLLLVSVFPDEVLSLEAERRVTLLYTHATYTGFWKKELQSLKVYNIHLNEQKFPIIMGLRTSACWYMGDNRVIYSLRSLSFSCLSTLSNLPVARSVFPKSLVLLESLLAAVTCQPHC